MIEQTLWLVTTINGSFRGIFSSEEKARGYISQVHPRQRRVLEYTIKPVTLDIGRDMV